MKLRCPYDKAFVFLVFCHAAALFCSSGSCRPSPSLVTVVAAALARLRPADIGFVHVGMPASVKLDAYDYSIYGMLKGSVVYISPDAITEMAPQGELLYYRVQIRLDEDEALLRRGKEIDILPGMTANIDIRTGEKTVLSYLTKPIIKVFHESMSER